VKRAVTDKEGKFALKDLHRGLVFKLLVVAKGREPVLTAGAVYCHDDMIWIFSEQHIVPAAGPVKFSLVLGRQVGPLPVGPTAADLDRIFTDLDNDAFKIREKASRELAQFGESAVPGVRERLKRRFSLEVRRRAAAFLDQFDPAELSPQRGVELLERIATPATKEFLAELAKGPAEAPLSLHAAAALTRLGRKPAGQP
jgi:hypothetical protein